MIKKVVANEVVIPEVIRFVEMGQPVVLPVRGNSMLPFIIGDRESVELVKPSTVNVGDVVLAWVDGKRYVVHRVMSIEGDRVELMGDGNIVGREHCRLADVSARADYVIGKSGKRHYLYTRRRKVCSRLWWKLSPIRRIILGVYRRTILKLYLNN